VDDRVHPSDRVDLIRDALRLCCASEISGYQPRGTRGEPAECCGTISRTRVQYDAVTLIEERLCRRAAETIRAAGDEYDCHALLLQVFLDALYAARALLPILIVPRVPADPRWHSDHRVILPLLCPTRQTHIRKKRMHITH
jgi:hypothetical protein